MHNDFSLACRLRFTAVQSIRKRIRLAQVGIHLDMARSRRGRDVGLCNSYMRYPSQSIIHHVVVESIDLMQFLKDAMDKTLKT